MQNPYDKKKEEKKKTFWRLRWAGLIARMGDGRNAFNILTGKRPLGRWRWWYGDIRIYIIEKKTVNTGNCNDSAQVEIIVELL